LCTRLRWHPRPSTHTAYSWCVGVSSSVTCAHSWRSSLTEAQRRCGRS
jgi:hypothetical protein